MPEVKTLLDGLAIGESPRWHDGRLWLSNWTTQEIVAVDLDGAHEVTARVETYGPYSIDWTPDGRLLVVQGQENLLLGETSSGALDVMTDLSGVGNVFNEIVVDGRGNVYVNAICFDMMAGEEFAPGIVALVRPDGSVHRVADGIAFPNGMAVTPDNSTLIVAESYGNRLTAFDIGDDGTLGDRRVWADLGDGVPDGICLDTEGAAWYADVPNRRCVRVREGGEVLETVSVDRGCFACMLGGADGTTLFIAAAEWAGVDGMMDEHTGRVLTADAPAAGAGWPGRTS